MKQLFALLILFCFCGSVLADDSETLTCDGETTPATWTATGGSVPTIMEDASDASYILSSTADQAHTLTVDNTGNSWDSIDSVVVDWRWATKNESKACDVSMSIYDGTSWNYGSMVDISGTPYDTTEVFTTAPSGGAWTASKVDAIRVQFTINVTCAGGGGDYVYELNGVTVWGTITAGAASSRRRNLLGQE